jgi:hypothetical protein
VITLSDNAFQLILNSEVGGGREYYDKKLIHPTLPPAQSGITIGIGYDLGYRTHLQFMADWNGRLSPDPLGLLDMVTGRIGEAAALLLPLVQDIVIPWELAINVFKQRTLPEFLTLTENSFPGITALPPDVQGALVSLVFNRGASFKGPRRIEMLRIRQAVVMKDIKAIANNIRAMKRLWVNSEARGLLARREAEAQLVESCV